jgi:hypothetical protein
MRCSVDAAESLTLGTGVEPPKSLGTDQKFGFTGEPLYGSQGKNIKLNNNLSHTDMPLEATGHWGSTSKINGFPTTSGSCTKPHPYQHRSQARLPATLNLLLSTWEGLNPPRLATSGAAVRRQDQDQLRKENKCRRRNLKATGECATHWMAYEGSGMPIPPTDHALQSPHYNLRCPAGQALQHPAASLLNELTQLRCPTRT